MQNSLIAIAIVITVFILWRITSVARGARQRDEKLLLLLDPISEKFIKGIEVTIDEINVLAMLPHLRLFLYNMLKEHEQLPLFPTKQKSKEAQAEGILAYWLMHPNELHDSPNKIEVIEKIERIVDDKKCDFYVLRYKMKSGHWAAKDGWLLGLSGPFLENDVPYSGYPGAFSRCGDKYGEIKPHELVDWFIGVAHK